jgi:hypothetical protein
MKNNLLKTAFYALILCGTFQISNAQTTLIHYWHFNNTLPLSGAGGIHLGSIPADYTVLSTANPLISYKKLATAKIDTGYIDNLVGDVINQRQGFGGCCNTSTVNSAIRTRNPSDSMQFLWNIPTTGYKNIVIKYETQASSVTSGQHEQIYSYSTDGGNTFSTAGLPIQFDSAANSVWGLVTVDLSSISAVNNVSNLVFQITYASSNLSILANTTGTSGNNRYDNITVEGIPLSTSTGTTTGITDYSVGNTNAGSLFPNPTDGVLYTLGTNFSSVTVSDISGAIVYTAQGSLNQFDISSLKNGIYFVVTEDSQSGVKRYAKIMKQ